MTSPQNPSLPTPERDGELTHSSCNDPSRRKFIQTGTAVSAALASGLATTRVARGDEPVDNSDSQLVRIALVGAGGRGTGAADDSLSINENIKLVAIADLDEKVPGMTRGRMAKRHGEKVDVPDEKLYSGIDSYKAILEDPDVDVVMFATPPGFRPRYVAEAVDAGKHVFAEKPTCVDPAGYRICWEAHKQAEANGTCIVTGTQYRRQTNYIEAVKRIHEGAIGDIIAASARYCGNSIWHKTRREGMSDTEYQIYNWMHYIWLSGDQIAEQSVHNIDAINWIMGGPPESAFASGGRFTRPEGSEMWDSMSVDYKYPGNRLVSFKNRQVPGAQSDNSNTIYGSNGHAVIYGINRGAFLYDKSGKEIWSMEGDLSAAYKQEHKDLVDAVRSGKPIVELGETTDSSMTAVLGRMSAYTGQDVTWDFVTKESKLDLWPENFDIQGELPEPKYAVPGKTKLI
ncbi:Gfo/Idh/MocA family oxidoreductase [Rubripirellula amarantea]|uniref:Alpha-N-acetylgalactosaminidase n=1 Tax=Rubripirellula amarantea TaxID=2527999 RepID=A0A5C5WF77_9BACT|nr:Gfo/Idh/MocA family oxidoreductase [Rubripirellula amarantea]MDA8746211.1 Gfo/Idh/MocA family oxidoreductase [Rubripirellula amarantea]TWT49414.1 Alpha-N-acetylgalactosaminidase [Rubripirellula amarantea]